MTHPDKQAALGNENLAIYITEELRDKGFLSNPAEDVCELIHLVLNDYLRESQEGEKADQEALANLAPAISRVAMKATQELSDALQTIKAQAAELERVKQVVAEMTAREHNKTTC